MITGTSHDLEDVLELLSVVTAFADDESDPDEDAFVVDETAVGDAVDPVEVVAELLVVDEDDGVGVAVVGVAVVIVGDVVVDVVLCDELLGDGVAVDGVGVVDAGVAVVAVGVAVVDEDPPMNPPLLPPGGPPGGPSPWTGGMAHTIQALIHSTTNEVNRRRLGAAMALVF